MNILGLVADRNTAVLLKDDLAALLDETEVVRDVYSPLPRIDTRTDTFVFFPNPTVESLCGQSTDYVLLDEAMFRRCLENKEFRDTILSRFKRPGDL